MAESLVMCLRRRCPTLQSLGQWRDVNPAHGAQLVNIDSTLSARKGLIDQPLAINHGAGPVRWQSYVLERKRDADG